MILIVIKSSKLEWDCELNGHSKSKMLQVYKKNKVNTQNILKSYDEQLYTREHVLKLFNGKADVCRMYELDNVDMPKYQTVVSLSGDNGFTYITKYITNQAIAYVNSSPSFSLGALSRWDKYNIKYILDNEFSIEQWPRLDAKINGEKITEAVSEYFFGEKERKYMSRHVLIFDGAEYEQKCSGVIIATGAGSTGWIEKAARYDKSYKVWEPTDRVAKFIITEPSNNDANLKHVGIIQGSDCIKLYSLNDNCGIASSDSWENFKFSRGSVAEIKLSDAPLNVMVPQILSIGEKDILEVI